ncbi:GEVED domain-containing protein [Aquimarina sp. 2201CG1-2-11]|uniref:GEVED domain-containing protein n=1 Tax=Aquimarina discodermiae TaxID=3231043 RepID=UPI003461A8D9
MNKRKNFPMLLKNVLSLAIIALLGTNLSQAQNSEAPFLPMQSGRSSPTQININDPAGTNCQDLKQSVCEIILIEPDGGKGVCTGSLLNTVNQNGKWYILTAAHCINKSSYIIGQEQNLYISFNYEAMDPAQRMVSSPTNHIIGVKAILRAVKGASDHVLFEITEATGELLNDLRSLNTYYAGWSLDKSSMFSNAISHPKSDIKKITANHSSSFVDKLYAEDVSDVSDDFANDSYFINVPVDGIYIRTSELQQGSSGCAGFNTDKQVFGAYSFKDNSFPGNESAKFNFLVNKWYKNPGRISFQEYLDPDITYVSNIPGGYGLNDQRHKIDSNRFNVSISSSATLSTPDIGMDGDVSNMVKLNFFELDSYLRNSDIKYRGGIYRIRGNAELKITYYRNNNPNDPWVIYSTKSDGSLANANIKFEELQVTTADITSLRDKYYLSSKKMRYNLPVKIEIINTGSELCVARAIRIPGLGYRNAVELFTPDAFKALYTNKNYPEYRARSSTEAYINSLTVKVTDPDTGLQRNREYTTNNNGGYVNLIQHKFPTMKPGSTVELSFTPRTTGGTMHYSAWIDYNSNQRFDVNEQVGTATSSTNTITFTVPDKPNKGTRIRIAMRKNSAPPANGSRSYDIGEVEDYTVKIVPSNRNSEVLASSVSQLSIGTGNYIAKPEGDKALSTGRKTNSNGGTTTVVTQVPVTDSSGNTSYATASVIDIQPTSDPNDGDLYTFKVKEGYLAVDTSSKLTSSTFNGKTILIRKLKVVNTATPVKVYGFNLTQGGSNKTYYSLQASDGDPYAITSPMELIPVSSISDGTSPTAPTPLSSSVNHADVAKHLTTGDKSGIAIGSATVIGIGVGIIFKFRRTLSRVPGQAMRMVKSCDSKSGGEGVSLLENTEL